eukprot:1144741-Pyramimonas_sp.AAC.1
MIASERQAVVTATSQSASAAVAAARIEGERVATARQNKKDRSSKNNFKLPGWKLPMPRL